MLVIAVVAIVVVGPRDLPKVMRGVSLAMRKMRALAGEFQSGMSALAQEVEFDDLKRQVENLAKFDVPEATVKMMEQPREYGGGTIAPGEAASHAPSLAATPPGNSTPTTETGKDKDE